MGAEEPKPEGNGDTTEEPKPEGTDEGNGTDTPAEPTAPAE